jgi:AAA domain, putative AbiEii toxin, Type IV TA system/AAA ATPase domain
MVRRLDLINFKAFEKFRIDFRDDAFLVGPNNAGKSTILAALRAGAYMARLAYRRQATDALQVDGVGRFGWNFSGDAVRLIDENLRHEFHQTETRLVLHFSSGATLNAIWPAPDEDEPTTGFFYIRDQDVTLRRPAQVRQVVPTIGVVPVLAPFEHTERLLSDDYIRDSRDGRLASRHFRNQARLYQLEAPSDDRFSTRWDEFRAFATRWLPELALGEPRVQYGDETSVDLFYEEVGSRIPKEVFWAGDGAQIWLQLLLHMFRLRDEAVVVLDEPDVFLHPDLQRRMVQLLESLEAQTITATHSAEVVAEARDEAVLWVSKNRRRSVRSPKPKVLYELSTALGTAFNLPLARVLRARRVLFVEGKDGRLVRDLASTLRIERITVEGDLVIVPMLGFDRWEHLEPFQWLMSDLLRSTVSGYVILDRDYRSEDAVRQVETKLRSLGFGAHVWRRKELENYLLVPSAIARLSGADTAWVATQLAECADSLEDDVWAQIHAAHEQLFRAQRKAPATIAKLAKQAADMAWSDPARRLEVSGGKDLLRLLNGRLQAGGHTAVTDRQLARRLRISEIADEVRATLHAVADG